MKENKEQLDETYIAAKKIGLQIYSLLQSHRMYSDTFLYSCCISTSFMFAKAAGIKKQELKRDIETCIEHFDDKDML